jgi:TatD DNase family protein
MKIDTHAHLNHPLFSGDRKKIIQKCLDENFYVINIGTNLQSSKEVVELTSNKNFFATVGLHPQNLKTGVLRKKIEEKNSEKIENEFGYEEYKKLAKNKKVVAIGEIGLDYYWKPKTTKRKKVFKKKQKDLLLKQLKLAKELDLSVVFHCRMANQDLIKLLKNNLELKPSKAVMHCFVGTEEELMSFLKLGFYIGFNGIIFKKLNNINFKKIVQKTPLQRILVETDCPFLTPPQEGEKRNEPFFVKYVLEKIAEIKNIESKKILKTTFENAQKMFKI